MDYAMSKPLIVLLAFAIAMLFTAQAKAQGSDSGWSDSYVPSVTWVAHAPAQTYDQFICHSFSRGLVWASNSKGALWVGGKLCYALTPGQAHTDRVTTKVIATRGTVTDTICLYRYGMIKDKCVVLKVRV